MEEIRIEIESKYENVPGVCDKVKSFCIQSGMSERDAIDFEICIDEALNNVVKHSYKSKPGNKIEILLNKIEGYIKVDIIDYGEARKGKVRKSIDFDEKDIDSFPEGGMGLFIIEQLTDKTEYKSLGDKNIFSLYKNIL